MSRICSWCLYEQVFKFKWIDFNRMLGSTKVAQKGPESQSMSTMEISKSVNSIHLLLNSINVALAESGQFNDMHAH